MKDFKNLKIWQHGISIALDVYNASKKIHLEELYGSASQIRIKVQKLQPVSNFYPDSLFAA